MKKNLFGILLGFFLLGMAVLLLGNVFGWWNVVNFSGWWTVFLIVPGLSIMISGKRVTFGSLFLVGLGVLLLAKERGWLAGVPQAVFWILLLVVAGLWLIFGSFRKRGFSATNDRERRFEGDPFDFPEHVAIFSGTETASISQQLGGGRLTAIFGSVEIDLRQAVILDGAVLEATAIFGGVEILLPEHCRVRTNGVHILGGTSEGWKRQQYPNEQPPLITIRDTCIFGGIDIK